jgi:signal transduction histidine kinase
MDCLLRIETLSLSFAANVRGDACPHEERVAERTRIAQDLHDTVLRVIVSVG